MSPLDSVTLTWEINNFANLYSCTTSSNFKTKQDEFWLGFYPKDYMKDMPNHVTMVLLRGNQHKTDLKVLLTISLINTIGQECYSKVLETNYTVQSKYYPIDGGLYHIDRDTILRPSSGLLTLGRLIIKYTVTIIQDQIITMNIRQQSIYDHKLTFAKNRALENYQPHLDKSNYSDVVFVIGVKQFKLHKIILASQSPVFAAMFENDLEEAKMNRVEVLDIDAEVFEAMVRFIYTGNADSVNQYALNLFVAADKYQLETLKDICVDSLGSNLSIEMVANILFFADMHSAPDLKSKCIDFVSKNCTDVMESEGWKLLIQNRIQLVLELYQDLAVKYKFG